MQAEAKAARARGKGESVVTAPFLAYLERVARGVLVAYFNHAG